MNKRILYFIIISLFLISLIGCASFGDGEYTDGIPFVYYNSFVYNDDVYDVFEVEQVKLLSTDLDDSKTIKYDYQELEKVVDPQNTNNWTINYYQNYEYQMSKIDLEKEVLNALYDNIQDSLKTMETSLQISLEYYADNRIIEREFVVDVTKTYTSILIVDLYIPYRLVNTRDNQIYIIYIPVKTSLAYRNNETIEFVFDDQTIVMDYHTFISLSDTQ